LIRLFDAGLADLVEPNGEIILSGILDHQAESVIAAGEAKGLNRGELRQIGDWVALSLKK
jgi:ribosomal protein L11 methylase PrmA